MTKRKDPAELKKVGPKSKYDPGLHPILAKRLARNGLTDREIASELKISENTLNRWKRLYPEIGQALRENKQVIDYQVEGKLLQRALGFDYEETKVVATKDGKVTRVEKIKKHAIPDVLAQIFWLKNRDRLNWRDHQPELPPEQYLTKEDDNFIQALKEEATDVWKEEGGQVDNP